MSDSPNVEQAVQEFKGLLGRARSGLGEYEFQTFVDRCINILDDIEEEFSNDLFDEDDEFEDQCGIDPDDDLDMEDFDEDYEY